MSQHADFIFANVKRHLMALGCPEGAATSAARKGVEHWERCVGNSKNPFNEACDYAGKLAQTMAPRFKYVSPKAARGSRVKRPQEAFDFGPQR